LETLDFRLLFDSSPDVLLVLLPDSPRFTMVAATEARLRVTHTTREQTLGRGLFEIFPDNPDDTEATGTSNLRASLERVLATREPDTMAVQKYDIRGPDGSFISKYWSPKNIPVLGAGGEVLYILHRVEDVTELVQASELGEELRDRTRRMEREILSRSRELSEAVRGLRDANEKLGELDAAKTAFFSNVSHEFRTPLTLILGVTERALSSPEPAIAGEDLAALHRNSLRLLRLVNSLLDFSRIESGRLTMSFAPTDLSELTAGLAGAFQSLFDDAGIRFVVECEPLPEPVYVDSAHWEKVMMNLLSNAFKFTFEGEIRVTLSFAGDHVELSVRDTGTGIPEAELPRIFERFHRVEGARGRSFEGSGIGLSLVHELVRLHGGSIDVKSEVGRGSTFTVAIPTGSGHLPKERISVAPPPANADDRNVAAQLLEAKQWMRSTETVVSARTATPGDGAAADPSVSRARLLVADDNADMRQYLERLLSPHWDVELVPNGRVALLSALASPPALVLSDVMMPEMDGVALLDALRADPRTSIVPVILISARAGEEERLAGLETGADDYLVKPFSAREVVTRIRTQLETAKARRAAADTAQELADTRAELLARIEREHSALQQTYRELRETQSQLIQSAKMASLGALVAGVAHEINNPLSFALSHLQTVEKSLAAVEPVVKTQPDAAVPWERARHRLGELSGGLSRIKELVKQLRTFSRLDEGEKKLVSVRESVESTLTILKHRYEGRVEITTRFGDSDTLDCFASQLNQAIFNLLGNAIDAIADNGSIDIQTATRDGAFELVVSDDGAGIPETIRDRIFEPFFTTKAPGAGMGLGLSVTYAIAKNHGGSIEIAPRDGGGTVAKLRIPLASAELAQ
jgi:signal transduction histidine kinase